MSSNCLHETPFLNKFIGLDLYPINYQATHKAGNVLDNILTAGNFSQLEVTIHYTLRISDSFPVIFQCFRDNSAYHADPVPCAFSFNSVKELELFISSWSSFSFENYPSNNNTNQFYAHLSMVIPSVFRKNPREDSWAHSIIPRTVFIVKTKWTPWDANVCLIQQRKILLL